MIALLVIYLVMAAIGLGGAGVILRLWGDL